MNLIDEIRAFLRSLYGDIPADFDESMRDVVKLAAPEDDAYLSDTLLWFAVAVLAVLVAVVFVVRAMQ
jgi:hypothetical protein